MPIITFLVNGTSYTMTSEQAYAVVCHIKYKIKEADINESRARVDSIPEAERCEKCGGEGWCRGTELDHADQNTIDDTMTRYSCDWCDGIGRKKEEGEPWWFVDSVI